MMMRAGNHNCRRLVAARCGRRGFTLLELLVVVTIILVLLSLLVPVLAKVRQTQQSVQCSTTLGKIALGFHAYAAAHQGRLPNPGIVDKSWEQLLIEYYDGRFECRADSELYPAVGSSYDWRDTGNDSTTLAGKLLMSVKRSDVILVYEGLPGWHARGQINVARVDGSVATISEESFFQNVTCTIWSPI